MIKKIKIIFILLITSIVSAQKESFNVELNQIRFKSNTMQDLVLENIKDYKITHKIEPQIIIFLKSLKIGREDLKLKLIFNNLK